MDRGVCFLCMCSYAYGKSGDCDCECHKDKEMTNNEKLFRLLGWKECSISNRGDGWKDTRHIQHLNLPDVSNFFELCRRWIIPEMRGKHIYYEIKFNKFHWYFSGFNERPFKYLSAVEIIDDNIAAALVESAIEVLGKDNG